MRLELDEFLARWEALPDLKNAELIEGVVYLSSPVSVDHGENDNILAWWLRSYAFATRGCKAGNNITCSMLGQSPQPDVLLRVTEEFGGKSVATGKLLVGAPELAAEICVTSAEIDFGPKLALYQRAGVREYITVQTLLPRIVWRALVSGRYQAIRADSQGILRSQCFPGLWLDTEAFWAEDGSRMSGTINLGLESAAHREFVEQLARKAK